MAPATTTQRGEPEVEDIPELDLSHSQEDEFLQAVREGCQEIGCFRIVNHGISPDLIRKADLASREAFKLPLETKKKNVSPNPFMGYVGGIPEAPFYESLGIELAGAPDREAVKDFSHIMWPQGNQFFSETMEEFTCEMMEMSKKVHQVILASLGVGKYYASDFDHGKALFRMNMYEVPSELPSESYGLGPHKDGTSISILYGDGSSGLQVLKAGNWVDVKPVPNTFVAMAGDTFQAWSNGRIRSTKHRVMLKKQQSRLSLGLFGIFPNEMIIKTPPELIDDAHPQRYKSYKFEDMVTHRAGEGRLLEEPLEAFVGISM
ncbi:hypothetical protein SUGI_0186680 [Cryptomeria japonica]|uniref:probable 2-oxoglutarate-dependent dioxygenase AOP1 n=1 Tax=Cryptomeria japonica TaxID=3369 RepID=UPI002408E950|nr:probable 2-oxoglutarate-dependent dioxygenase AOP1 [Cryptomeria japonica]GLJ12210.1 hypothetical protein SUGI_0186680 [Cryptomeria japonica]